MSEVRLGPTDQWVVSSTLHCCPCVSERLGDVVHPLLARYLKELGGGEEWVHFDLKECVY